MLINLEERKLYDGKSAQVKHSPQETLHELEMAVIRTSKARSVRLSLNNRAEINFKANEPAAVTTMKSETSLIHLNN